MNCYIIKCNIVSVYRHTVSILSAHLCWLCTITFISFSMSTCSSCSHASNSTSSYSLATTIPSRLCVCVCVCVCEGLIVLNY